MEIQALLGSDVAMALDQLVDPDSAHRAAWAMAMERTHRWADGRWRRAAAADQAVFGIVQGGIDPTLRRESVAAIARAAVRRHRRRRPLGGGVESRDGRAPSTSSPTRLETTRARGTSWASARRPTSSGGRAGDRPLRLRPPHARRPHGPGLDRCGSPQPAKRRLPRRPGADRSGCACEACREHSRAYLAHLFRSRELLGYRLATLHNVTWTLELMRRLRASLSDGTFARARRRRSRRILDRARRMTAYDMV